MIRPKYTLAFNGQEYELLGTFELIEAAESALQTDILRIGSEVIDLPVGKTAKLLSAILTVSGQRISAGEIGRQLVDEIGVTSEDYARLKLHLYAALRIFVSPPTDREDVSRNMGELIGKLNASPWREYQEFCLGVLRWPPKDFWQSTVSEVSRAYDGYALSKGITKRFDASKYPSREEREELHRRLKERHGDA